MPDPKRILIVEDEALILLDLENALSELGHSVVSADSASGGEALLMTDQIDMAIIDFHLKDGTSAGLARQLGDRGIPFVLCTGTARSDELLEVPQRTVFLEKPYTSDGLRKAVEQGLAVGAS